MSVVAWGASMREVLLMSSVDNCVQGLFVTVPLLMQAATCVREFQAPEHHKLLVCTLVEAVDNKKKRPDVCLCFPSSKIKRVRSSGVWPRD